MQNGYFQEAVMGMYTYHLLLLAMKIYIIHDPSPIYFVKLWLPHVCLFSLFHLLLSGLFVAGMLVSGMRFIELLLDLEVWAVDQNFVYGRYFSLGKELHTCDRIVVR